MKTPNIIIKELRERYGLSIRKLGSLIDISFSSLSRIERGGGSPNMGTVNALTHFFNVTSDYLLGSDDKGFLLFYEEGEKTYCDIITEEELDKYIENKEVEEHVGLSNIVRNITSQQLINKIKQGIYYDKDDIVHNPYVDLSMNIYKKIKNDLPNNLTNKYINKEKVEIIKAYMSLSDVQRKLVDDLVLSLAGGNKNGQ